MSSTTRALTRAIEYALIAALISVVIIGALIMVGTNLSDVFNSVATALRAARDRG